MTWRSGVIAMLSLSSTAGHRLRVWAYVDLDGTGDLAPLSDGRGQEGVLRWAAVVWAWRSFRGLGLGNGQTRQIVLP